MISTVTISGEKKTYVIKCPSKIGYTVKAHIHNFVKGFGNAWAVADGGLVVTNKCSCGYKSKLTWELPDPEGAQTGAQIIQGQNMIVSQQYTHPAMR